MEDNNTYTYQRPDKNEQDANPYNKRLIMLFIAAIALIIVLGVVLGKYLGMRSATKQAESTSPTEIETESETEPSEVEPTALYSEGEYVVSTGGVSLKFRKGYSTDSDVILEIKDGTKLTITEVYHNESAQGNDSAVEYWGKTTYYGYEGWVAMNYLTNTYSDSIITPEEVPSSEESTTGDTEASRENTTEPTSAPQSTEAPSSEAASSEAPSSEATSAADESTTAAQTSKYTAGEYKVATGGSTLSFRKSASTSADIITGLSDGTKVTVIKVVDIGGNNEATRYWGEISYLGYTGYVSMYYLEKVS